MRNEYSLQLSKLLYNFQFVRAFENMRSAKNFNFSPPHRSQIGPHGSIPRRKRFARKRPGKDNDRKTLKTRRRSKTFKGSQRMGGGQIFLKTFGASLFNEDLSNEPYFGRIHLAGQYL